MNERQYEYEVPAVLTAPELLGRLEANLRVLVEPPEVRERTWLDSFDWRVYEAGGCVIAEFEDEACWLRWRELDSGRLLGAQQVADLPRFVWDPGLGSLRERLEPILEMRALLPRVTERIRAQALRVVNKDHKTVLWLLVEDCTAVAPGTGKVSADMGTRLHLVPVKGYPRPLVRVRSLLENDLGLTASRDNRLQALLAAIGQRPADYSSKLKLKLNNSMTGGEATRHILLNLLDTLERNEVGTRENLDSEFLHDFRVAVRRTRSALSQIKDVIATETLERFKAEFGWLGQLTGPTRDMDVYLLSFDDYRASLSSSLAGDLEPLRAFLHAHHRVEQAKLADALASKRYRKLLKDWRAFLGAGMPPGAEAVPNANRPVHGLANERIWRMYRRVLKEGRAITPQSPAEDLHELRKTCKKLRYLMEFFQSLYPGGKIKALIKVLKAFQENLGDFQDYEVQAASLKHFSEQMMEEGEVPAAALMAMGILVDGLERRQHQAREEFAQRFADFSLPENRMHFAELFASA